MRVACCSFILTREHSLLICHNLLILQNNPPMASAGVGAVDLLSPPPPWSQEHLVLPLSWVLLDLILTSLLQLSLNIVFFQGLVSDQIFC